MIKTICFCLLVLLIGFSMSTTFAQEQSIPNWIKEIAKLWSSDQISDKDFLYILQHLIDLRLLDISNFDTTQSSNNSSTITVYTSKIQYGPDEDVVIFGTITELVDDHRVSVVISSINGKFMSINKVTPNIDGSYAFVAKEP
ncbi:ABC-type phosphate-phosphonate transport system periplasmic component protein [Marine Group I thaumarchaeote SCGC AAA799-E16]|uniref:ABC-type phosphate-phosphonate transport system periplasmic component protein n=1 Tax=Marine Group I thaumarchaeote SCGC AAA799-E16 TaxID=1502292 RepID=A0A081S501_9ARCH|nr:ABC-type phosphate-phosphonate transport system periplasmic component protein [Marine Group I thaumarchaeote SCGC AAA799-E16]